MLVSYISYWLFVLFLTSSHLLFFNPLASTRSSSSSEHLYKSSFDNVAVYLQKKQQRLEEQQLKRHDMTQKAKNNKRRKSEGGTPSSSWTCTFRCFLYVSESNLDMCSEEAPGERLCLTWTVQFNFFFIFTKSEWTMLFSNVQFSFTLSSNGFNMFPVHQPNMTTLHSVCGCMAPQNTQLFIWHFMSIFSSFFLITLMQFTHQRGHSNPNSYTVFRTVL